MVMSLVSSILKKHKKQSFFERHREAFASLSDQELDTIFRAQPDLMVLFQELSISEEFSKRVVFSGIRQSAKNIHRFKLYDQSQWLIEALCSNIKRHKAAELLLSIVPRDKLTQAIFDFIIHQHIAVRISQLPRTLITSRNCMKVLVMDPGQWRQIPRHLIDEELALAMYRADSVALSRIPTEMVTEAMLAKGTVTLSHFEKLDEEKRAWFAKCWIDDPSSVGLTYYADRPLDFSVLLDRYQEVEAKRIFAYYKTPETIFLEDVLKVAYVDDLWYSAKNKTHQEQIIKIHGKKLLSVEGFPVELKRKWLEDDLNI
jgi:hypothetical protein